MGRRRGRWRRAGKGQEWEGKGEAGGWTRRSGVGGGDRIVTMGRRLGGGNGEGEKKGQEEEAFYRWIRFNVWVDIGYRIELQADSMPGATEVMVFTVSYKHM